VQKNPFKQKKRLTRILRLLRRLRPSELPVTHRHNHVQLFPEGAPFFVALLAAIHSAQHTILLEYYTIHDDQTGGELAVELAAAVRRGVKVQLIYDYIGCVDTPSSYFNNLAIQGIDLFPFNKPSFKRGIYWFDKRDHRKMTIIDDQLAFLGGFNIGDEYSGRVDDHRRFRDLGLSIRGDAVRELIAVFNKTKSLEHEEPIKPLRIRKPRRSDKGAGHASVVIISGGPRQRRAYIREAFQVNIASAAEEILIATPYFVPGPRIIRSLLRAARRGVRVRLLLPARSDVRLVLLLGRSSYSTLLKGGVEIFELKREILHAKVMLIDGERTVIGSANLDQRSFHRNYEINCVVDNVEFGGQIRELLRQEISISHRVRLDVHERRGLMTRAMERVVRLFAWFL
jgi:cardiolipin synthase